MLIIAANNIGKNMRDFYKITAVFAYLRNLMTNFPDFCTFCTFCTDEAKKVVDFFNKPKSKYNEAKKVVDFFNKPKRKYNEAKKVADFFDKQKIKYNEATP